ncbi:EpsG family protein [Flavobacterium psychrophilum]|nr:EpsG family protein [Flavobacterium psychrophilum]SNA68306.1 Probable transmembrane protein. Putative polysaccharide export protein [Flavobacterium psychrophilum]
MDLIYFLIVTVFITYYLACLNNTKIEFRFVLCICFIILSTCLRELVDLELNRDYYGYYLGYSLERPESLLAYFTKEPYLYLIHNFFLFFTTDYKKALGLVYVFNFILNTLFFVWLMFKKDIVVWKKMLIFIFYYFLFGYTLLRNGPVYMLFGVFFYNSFRNYGFKKVLFTPFFHFSSVLILVTYFHRSKYYFKFLALFTMLASLFYYFLFEHISGLSEFEKTLSKVDSYSEQLDKVSVFHYYFLAFIVFNVFISYYFLKERFFHPIIISTVVFYFIAFFIATPVVAYRISPYFIISLLFFNTEKDSNKELNRVLNISAFFLLPFFIFTYIDNHNL